MLKSTLFTRQTHFFTRQNEHNNDPVTIPTRHPHDKVTTPTRQSYDHITTI
jgi:hypothetical protein